MSLAVMLAAPKVGRPKVTEIARERQRHIECAGLMLHSNWPVKRIAASFGIARYTAYRWRDLALTYDEPEAQALHRHKR